MPLKKYNIDVSNDNEYTYINLHDFGTRAYTEYCEELHSIVTQTTWTISDFYDKPDKKQPRYLFSNKLKKSFHQVVMDFHYGEEVRKKAQRNKMVIDHIRNDSALNCCVSNLYFLLDSRNEYKGKFFDKLSRQNLPFYALRVFHIKDNETFQITIGFTVDAKFSLADNRPIVGAKFLYENIDYWNVIQDAETMINNLIDCNKLEFNNKLYRYSKYKLEFGKYIKKSQIENIDDAQSGSVVLIDGELHMINKNDGKMIIYEIPYEKDWSSGDK